MIKGFIRMVQGNYYGVIKAICSQTASKCIIIGACQEFLKGMLKVVTSRV